MSIAQATSESRLEVREANHRMMNVLATLQAIFRRGFSQFSDQCVRSAVTQFESHIMAAGELLRTISTTPPANDVAIDVYLERLGRALSRAILSPSNIGCEVFSDQGRLAVEVCERLGLIIVELVLNASKYAFAGRSNGVVRVEMKRSGRHWRCTVSDNGIGMVGPGYGTGLKIVEALVRSLKGRLNLRSGASGTCACVLLPDQSSENPAHERQLSEVRQTPENPSEAQALIASRAGTMFEQRRLLVG
jgi:two-component sensor histidine kinase